MLQPLSVDLKRSAVEIPNIVLAPNNPQCVNEFNKKQLNLVEKNYSKCLAKMTNFHNIHKKIDQRQRNKH